MLAVPMPPFMPLSPRPRCILPTVAPAPAPTFPSGTGDGRRRRAGLVGGLGIRPDARIADREIVDHRRDDDGDAQVGRAPVEADLVLLEIAEHAAVGVQREDAAAGEKERVDLLHRAHRLQHHDLRFARRRAVVVDAGGNGRIEEDRGAAGRPAGIGEVADADAAARR